MLRPLPIHGTQQLPNDDDESDNVCMSCRAGLESVMECVKVEFYPRTCFVYMLTNLAEC